MVYAIIIAGGVGNRVGAGIPKQFINVLGKPIIAYTLEQFQFHPQIDFIEIVCVDGYQSTLGSIVKEYGITKLIKIVQGGSEYERSIMNGVEGLKGIAKDDDIIMIHWSASPFVTEDLITDNIRVCKEKGNAISASYSYLLYGSNDGDCAKTTIDRESFMTLSAPQSFLYKTIVDVYKQVEENNMFETCEAHTTAFMTRLGIPLYFSKGSHTNIKITTKEDVDLFRGYILNREFPSDEVIKR
jgi:2-C-methyl-D-erythritol 4-phosphate cytidylyltransferase